MKKFDKEKILTRICKLAFLGFLCFFTMVYISSNNGYYNYEQSRKTVLTKQKIEQFEKDVKQGKTIKIENYVDNSKPNYQNKTSQLGLDISSKVGKYVSLSIKSFFKKLNKLVTD